MALAELAPARPGPEQQAQVLPPEAFLQTGPVRRAPVQVQLQERAREQQARPVQRQAQEQQLRAEPAAACRRTEFRRRWPPG